MSDHFEQVKEYVMALNYRIDEELPEEEIVIINDDERGIHNLVIDCEESVLVVEQIIIPLAVDSPATTYKQILQINRELVFGAFVLNDAGDSLLYRNTLALGNLDLNELESTINALSLGLAEHGEALLSFVSK